MQNNYSSPEKFMLSPIDFENINSKWGNFTLSVSNYNKNNFLSLGLYSNNKTISLISVIEDKILNLELQLFISKIEKLGIYILSSDKEFIKSFLSKHFKDKDSIMYILNYAKDIFENRELILKLNSDSENILNLIVRQESYSDDDIDNLDDLIYKSITFNSTVSVRNDMKCSIIPNTDYNVPEFKNEYIESF